MIRFGGLRSTFSKITKIYSVGMSGRFQVVVEHSVMLLEWIFTCKEPDVAQLLRAFSGLSDWCRRQSLVSRSRTFVCLYLYIRMSNF